MMGDDAADHKDGGRHKNGSRRPTFAARHPPPALPLFLSVDAPISIVCVVWPPSFVSCRRSLSDVFIFLSIIQGFLASLCGAVVVGGWGRGCIAADVSRT